MYGKLGFLSRFFSLLVLIGSLLVSPNLLQAKYIGADPPYCCQCANRGPCTEVPGDGAVSLTEGNLREQEGGSSIRSGFGPTINFSLTYNSYNADRSRAQIDTVMGYGWTHSYNIFLFNQRGHMFRMDGQGRVTKYQLGSGGTFTAAPGYFETLVKNGDGSFTLRQKDGTVFRFAFIPNTPFLVGGPVYRVTSITDRNNNITTPLYDGSGRLTSVTDTYGRSVTFTYNGQNKLATITDPLGRITTLQYDSTGRQLVKVIDPENKTTQYTYNFLYQITQKIDKDGRVFSYIYNSQNKPVAIKDGANANYFSLTNPNNWATDDTQLALNLVRVYLPSTTSKTDGRSNLWRYEYDARAYITRTIAPDGAITRYTYDPSTLMVATMTDANNRTTSYQYDTNGNMIRKTDANANVTTYTYEPVFSQMTSMTDANGRVTTYQYDATGNRIKETDPLNQIRQWTYDSHGNVLSAKDKRGNTSAYDYNASGNRVTATDAVGQPEQRQTMFTYDAVGNTTSRTDANNHTTAYQYDGLNRIIRVTDHVGKITRSFYDGQGNRTQVIDRNNNQTSYQYDLRKRLVKATDTLNQNVTQSYDGNDNRTSMTDKNNHTTSYQYDVQNRINKTTDAVGNVSTMTYDGVGNRLTETDANGHTTTYTYDALNRMTTRTDAVGNLTQMIYDMVGLSGCVDCTGPTRGSSLVTKQIDGNGKVTYFKYDGLDRPIIQIRKEGDIADVVDSGDAKTEFFYDANSNRTAVIEPNGNATTYEYDALNRQTKVTNAAGDVSRTTYDGVDNVTSVTSPTTNVTNYTYDALDRRIQVQDGGGTVMSYTYDFVGNQLTQTDGNGHTTTYTYDPIYRMTQSTDPLGQMTTSNYDAVGNVISNVDRNGKTTSYIYDDINRRTRMTDALGNITQYQYDGVGNLTKLTDANGHASNYAYDGVNRRVSETYADGLTRSYTYDFVGNLTSRTDQNGQLTTYVYNDLYFLLKRDYPVSPDDNMTYDLSGRMLSAERGGWLVTYSYDGANRVIQTTQNGQPINYAYNIPGRTRMIGYPGGKVITESMDIRSRLSRIDDPASLTPIVQYSYDVANRVGTRDYRNGTTASYTYNNNDWATSLEHTIGLTRIAGFGHDYDNEGNKRFEQKLSDSANSQSKSEAYQYDNIYRLIDYKVGTLVGSTVPVPSTQTQYTLDPVGNWSVKTKDAIPETRTHNAVNEITTINAAPLTYDANGNLTEDALYRYAYDEENRLTAVTRKSDSRLVGQYQYDALSRRVQKIANPAAVSTTTRYFYDDARIIEEQNTSAVTQATYVYGNYVDEVLTMDRSGQNFYFHQNTLWSVEAITDSSANVVERYSYDAYGLPTILNGSGVPISLNSWGTPHSAIGNPWMFTGRQLDEETGLYFYRARYYDPVKGRFLQRDPLGYVDGLDLYEYAASQPTANLDPMGLVVTVGGRAVDQDEKYKQWLKNDVYEEILRKLSAAKRTIDFKSMDDLELELLTRAAFAKCMERISVKRGEGVGCQFGGMGTKIKGGWNGLDYTGNDPSDALDRLMASETTSLECFTGGQFCAWVALRDAMEAQKRGSFNATFGGNMISITNQARNPLVYKEGRVDLSAYIKEQIPGDFIYFRNIKDYTIGDGPWSRENAVYIGKGNYCGFGITETVNAAQMRDKLLEKYNRDLGKNITPTPKELETLMPVENLRRINRNFRLPPPPSR